MNNYLRKWQITVGTQAVQADVYGTNLSADSLRVSDSDAESGGGRGALRCTFRVEKALGKFPWFAEVEIWNLNVETQVKIIEEGAEVILEAGYRDGPYGPVWDGNVFQTAWDRENITDFVTTLHCMDGFGIVTANMVNTALPAGYDYAGIIAAMARSARSPIPLGTISAALDPKKAPRGVALFGEPKRILRQICRDNNAQFFSADGTFNLTRIDDEYQKDALVLTPETGLVGVPQQIQYGVSFRTLLNPNLTVTAPPMVVKLDNTVIRQMKVRQGQVISPLDQDGMYKVARVCHTGDTRGDEWYTDVIGVNLAGKVSALFGLHSW